MRVFSIKPIEFSCKSLEVTTVRSHLSSVWETEHKCSQFDVLTFFTDIVPFILMNKTWIFKSTLRWEGERARKVDWSFWLDPQLNDSSSLPSLISRRSIWGHRHTQNCEGKGTVCCHGDRHCNELNIKVLHSVLCKQL